MEHIALRDLIHIGAVWSRLELVEERLYTVTSSHVGFLTQVAQHLLPGGKRYRPLLAQVAAELGPEPGPRAVEAGVAVELVHLGSLSHDDVIDEAASRHWRPSVNANWSNTVAILGGDFLLARASEVAAPLGEEAVALLAGTYATLCEGQVLELELTGETEHGAAEYFAIIEAKTASLIRTSARLGALAAGADRDVIEGVSSWAWEMGIVFQMTDDVLDLVGTEETLGKPAGSDVAEGVFTLPVLYALKGPQGPQLSRLLSGPRPYPEATVSQVIDAVEAGGYVDEVLSEAATRLKKANTAIDDIPPSEAGDTMRRLGGYLLDRVETARAR